MFPLVSSSPPVSPSASQGLCMGKWNRRFINKTKEKHFEASALPLSSEIQKSGHVRIHITFSRQRRIQTLSSTSRRKLKAVDLDALWAVCSEEFKTSIPNDFPSVSTISSDSTIFPSATLTADALKQVFRLAEKIQLRLKKIEENGAFQKYKLTLTFSTFCHALPCVFWDFVIDQGSVPFTIQRAFFLVQWNKTNYIRPSVRKCIVIFKVQSCFKIQKNIKL